MMWPPMGLRPSAPANSALAPGSDWTWFVMKTTILNSYEQSAAGQSRETERLDAHLCYVLDTVEMLAQGMLSLTQLTTTYKTVSKMLRSCGAGRTYRDSRCGRGSQCCQ